MSWLTSQPIDNLACFATVGIMPHGSFQPKHLSNMGPIQIVIQQTAHHDRALPNPPMIFVDLGKHLEILRERHTLTQIADFMDKELFNRLVSAWLVLFGKPNVVTASFHNLARSPSLRMHSIPNDNCTAQVDLFQLM